MAIAELIKQMETELQKPEPEIIISQELNNIEGEELMLYIQRLRQKSWDIANNYL